MEPATGFKMIYWTPISGSYLLWGSILEKKWKILEKRPFFRADMAELGKYHTGGYGRIGVYRVNTLLTTLGCHFIMTSFS